MSASKEIFLDVDSSIVENNLRITTDPNEEFSKLFPTPEKYPSKVVKPFPDNESLHTKVLNNRNRISKLEHIKDNATYEFKICLICNIGSGFCVKAREVETERKVFVNICHTDAIPAPQDISEEELSEILESFETENFRVPMSIGDIKTEKDKQGEEVKTCDIAINPAFFKKIQSITLFKNFFMVIVFEGLKEKHKINCTDDKIILKNKKSYGSLQLHRIQQRELDEKMGKANSNISLMEEVTGQADTATPKVKIETISSTEGPIRSPEYRLFKNKNGQKNCLIGEFKMPDIISSDELTLDIGEDRILLEAKSKQYLVDVFVPYFIRQDTCSSTFDKATKILTVKMPLVGG